MKLNKEEIQHLRNLYEGFSNTKRSSPIIAVDKRIVFGNEFMYGYAITIIRETNSTYKIEALHEHGFRWSIKLARDPNNHFKRPFWQHVCRKMQQIYLADKPEALKLAEHINSFEDELDRTDRFSQLL